MRRVLFLVAAVAAAPALPAAPGGEAGARRARVLMGTTCTADVQAADDEAAGAAAAAALDEIERLEGVLSTWRDDAEMSRVNAAAQSGEGALTPELAAALELALAQARRTGGAFDPAIGALVDAWDLRGAGRVPDADRLRAARAASGHERVRLDAANGRLSFDAPATWIDTGGFGKGLALDRAAGAAVRAGAISGLLDFGGQLLAFGPVPEGGWPVAVADPRDRERPALVLALHGGSASTSAQSERFVEVAGRSIGHVLDPRSGMPVGFRGSATVVAPTGAEADALSTALLVMGPREGLRFARRQGLCAGFLVPAPREGREVLVLRATPSFLALHRAADPAVLPTRAPSSRSLPR